MKMQKNKSIYITDEQKSFIKKTIKNVNAGIMDNVAACDMIGENSDDYGNIVLYHGVSAKGLEYNLSNGGFKKRVCSEGGPCAVWLSKKQYPYAFTFEFTFPKSELSDKLTQMTNVDYVYEDDIPFGKFNCRLVKTGFFIHTKGFSVEIDLCDAELLKRQMKYVDGLLDKIKEYFIDYPMVYDNVVKSYLKDMGIQMNEDASPDGSDRFVIGPKNDSTELNPYMHVGDINESSEGEEYFKRYFEEIGNFMDDNGLKVKPLPELNLDWSEQDGLFIRTGYYSPEEKSMTIFCKDRHPKDILRSMAHEYVHHAQNLEGKDLNFSGDDNVKDNKELEKLEAEAYLKGNIYFRKWTEYTNNENGNELLNESTYKPFDMEEDTNPEDVDLSSFNIKRDLNPKFWKNNLLDSRIRMKLLDIAEDFIDYIGVDWVKPDDIIMTGSLANYNWNKKYSDIDLHILIDYSKVDERRDFVKKYFDSLKNQWNDEHEDLKIFGFPVELYVQDTNEVHSSTGVYSIEKNKWVTHPDFGKLKHSKVNKGLIKDKVAYYMNKIDDIVEKYENSDGDDYKIRKISEYVDRLLDKIKNERKNSLGDGKTSEISNGNIIFKALRRNGYIDKLYSLKSKTYDEMNSLP